MQFKYNGFLVELDIDEFKSIFMAKLSPVPESGEPVILRSPTVDELEEGVFCTIGIDQSHINTPSPFLAEHLTSLNPRDFFCHESFENIDDEVLWDACRQLVSNTLKGVGMARAFDHLRGQEHAMRFGKKVDTFMKEVEQSRKKSSSSKGGKTRSAHQQRNYDAHRENWEEWQNNPKLYEGVTKFDEAMVNKTGAGIATVRRHRREFEGSHNNHK